MRNEPIGRCLSSHLFRRFAESKRLGLRKHIGKQNVVMPAKIVKRLSERDKIAGNESRALMDQLIEGVLAVGSGFTPVDLAGLIIHPCAIQRYMLPIALHR